MAEADDFDWKNHKGPGPDYVPWRRHEYDSIIDAGPNEKPFDRKLRMLRNLSRTCVSCSMCTLGLKTVDRGGVGRDPHVFSNMNPTRFVILGQNPGFDEVRLRIPFVGDAGQRFDKELAKHDVSRNEFYITNSLKCFTTNNSKPDAINLERCEPFLRMEINIIKPKLVVALGAVAFDQLCSGVRFTDSFGKLTKSAKYNVPVFPIYHPSPLNLEDENRRLMFEDQVRLLCKLIKKLREQAH